MPLRHFLGSLSSLYLHWYHILLFLFSSDFPLNSLTNNPSICYIWILGFLLFISFLSSFSDDFKYYTYWIHKYLCMNVLEPCPVDCSQIQLLIQAPSWPCLSLYHLALVRASQSTFVYFPDSTLRLLTSVCHMPSTKILRKLTNWATSHCWVKSYINKSFPLTSNEIPPRYHDLEAEFGLGPHAFPNTCRSPLPWSHQIEAPEPLFIF